jgi:hypothetical protein
MHKPIRVASGHSLESQEWGDPIRVASEDTESQVGDYDIPHHLRIGMKICLYVCSHPSLHNVFSKS